MDTHTIYDFYSFVEKISIICAGGFAVVLFFCTIAFLSYCDYKIDKKELIYCIVVAVLFIGCLACSICMNYLQIR